MTDPCQQSDDPSLRSFVTATGYIFQIVGLAFAGGGCLLWTLTGYLETQLDEPIAVVSDYFQSSARVMAISLACITTTWVAGLGMIATGLGMQGERPSSGRWAMVVVAILAIVWLAGAIGLWWISAPIWKILVSAAFAGAGSMLFMLAGNSARILKLHPPPEDAGVVSDEFLQEYSRRNIE